MNTTQLADIALTIAATASAEALRHFRTPLGVDFKADDSPVTHADRAVESVVRAQIAQHFPGHDIFGEEEGLSSRDSGEMWIIDPIDGTRSFISGHPLFGFLLAKLTGGKPELSVVALPALGETYLATRGGGATRNGTPVRVSGLTDLSRATVYINEGDRIHTTAPGLFAHLMHIGRNRRFAYDCCPYALLAAGYVDVVIDHGLQPYDTLPVSLLVHEAGGMMTDWQGRPLGMEPDTNTIATATPELHAAMRALVENW